MITQERGLKQGLEECHIAPSSLGLCHSLWEISPCGVFMKPQHDVFQSPISEKSQIKDTGFTLESNQAG